MKQDKSILYGKAEDDDEDDTPKHGVKYYDTIIATSSIHT